MVRGSSPTGIAAMILSRLLRTMSGSGDRGSRRLNRRHSFGQVRGPARAANRSRLTQARAGSRTDHSQRVGFAASKLPGGWKLSRGEGDIVGYHGQASPPVERRGRTAGTDLFARNDVSHEGK